MAGKPGVNTALVAFIDVLGLKAQLAAVRTDADIDKLYAIMAKVHEEFEKNPTGLFAEDHAATAKTVLAISDAVVIGMDMKSPFSAAAGSLTAIAMELYSLALSQALCVIKGIFLRGGVSLGFFFNDKDILLSQALSEAYQLEQDQAVYPVIVLDKKVYRVMRDHPENRHYARKDRPIEKLLYRYTERGKSVSKYCLNYFAVGIDAATSWYSGRDLMEYKQEKDPKKKQEILNKSFEKSRVYVIREHKKMIKKQLSRHKRGKVRQKYIWLREYHNEIVGGLGSQYARYQIARI